MRAGIDERHSLDTIRLGRECLSPLQQVEWSVACRVLLGPAEAGRRRCSVGSAASNGYQTREDLKEVNVENRQNDDTLGEEISAVGQRVKGAAKDVAGNVANDRGLEREGERDKAEGRARQATNNVFDETDGVRGAPSRARPVHPM